MDKHVPFHLELFAKDETDCEVELELTCSETSVFLVLQCSYPLKIHFHSADIIVLLTAVLLNFDSMHEIISIY